MIYPFFMWMYFVILTCGPPPPLMGCISSSYLPGPARCLVVGTHCVHRQLRLSSKDGHKPLSAGIRLSGGFISSSCHCVVSGVDERCTCGSMDSPNPSTRRRSYRRKCVLCRVHLHMHMLLLHVVYDDDDDDEYM